MRLRQLFFLLDRRRIIINRLFALGVLVHFGSLLPDGVDQVLIDQEHELESGNLQHRVVAQLRLAASGNLQYRHCHNKTIQ